MSKLIEILGVKIGNYSLSEVVFEIKKMLKEETGGLLATINAEFIVEAYRNKKFKEVLNGARLSICDGSGPALAAKILKGEKLNRVTGVDLVNELFKLQSLGELEAKFYLLGGGFEVAEKLAKKLRVEYEKIMIVGAESGGNINPETFLLEKNEEVLNRINQSGANIILVAFGQVKQENWIVNNLSGLKNIKVAIGVGGTFDYLLGKVKRAPKLMRLLGLEWLYRLIKEPKRWKRIFNAVIVFPLLVIFNKK